MIFLDNDDNNLLLDKKSQNKCFLTVTATYKSTCTDFIFLTRKIRGNCLLFDRDFNHSKTLKYHSQWIHRGSGG